MPGIHQHIRSFSLNPVVLDMSDCYTWSFPEFIPFCSSLFSISTFKDFNTSAQA